MTESQILAEIRLALGAERDAVFWRNNVGMADLNGQHVRYGLAVGSSDLIGLVAGRFCALEVKAHRGRVTDEQARYLALVRSKGGFACVVRSADEARAAVVRCREGASE